MAITFKRATKKQSRLRLALVGPAGSGKTYSALKIASALGQNIAVIDTEHGSASKYSDVFKFDVLELESFNPTNYIEAIEAADAAGYDVIVIDSASHAWDGKDGALELKDRKSRNGNSFTAWADITPLQHRFIEAQIASKAHIIATMRSKTEYVIETDSKGKQVPRRVGMGAVQRQGVEYEYDVVGYIDLDHTLTIEKTRCPAVDGQAFPKPGEKFAQTLLAWLTDGAAAQEQTEFEKILAGMKDQATCTAAVNSLLASLDDADAKPILERHGEIKSPKAAKNLAADLYAALQASRESRAA